MPYFIEKKSYHYSYAAVKKRVRVGIWRYGLVLAMRGRNRYVMVSNCKDILIA